MQRDRQKLFLEGPIGVALFRLAVPIILANVLQTGYQLTDAFWVGRLGASAVAAVSVSFPVTFLVIALGSGLGIAGATLSAQYMGAGRQNMVNHVAAQTMLMVFVTSVILGTTGYLLAPYLLHWMGVEADVYRDGLAFMRVAFVGIIFVFMFAMFQALMRGIGQTMIPLLIVLGTVLLNIVLDPMFIFGWGPIPEQGVRGAALATLATQGIAALVGMIVFLRGRHGIQLRLADFRPDFPYIKRAFLLGAPGSVELSTRALGLIVLSFLVASFGTVTIASYGVGANVLQFVMIPAMGLSMAVSTLVGQNIGAGNITRASKVAILGACWGFGILTSVGILAFLFARYIVAFFVPDDQAVIDHGAEFIRVMSLAWGGLGIQLCMIATFRASGNFLISMVIALVSQWMIQFPVAYILSKHTPLEANGIWWSFPVMHGLMAIVAVAWFAQGGWKKTRLTAEDDQVRQVTEETIVEDGMP
ncbi:MATE family efflux transporter [Blastopirellula marina]|uniref:MATE family efflux transporter n=1 Tax=Blastopirellula marina TaxID=124 RepID=A0A2S8GDL7_9BACT|nr:MATE family efflux transporter [Blastopirellula marina]PQO42558.1 MATE family efflux transporter [Blastopirellula marina]PTL46324.1 MATE family efflux transporter [Blastopirellula marina]